MHLAMLGAAGAQFPDFVSRDSASATNPETVSSITFSARSLGPESTGRRIVVVVLMTDLTSSSNSITSITLGGSAATSSQYAVNTGAYGNSVDTMIGIAEWDMPTGTTADVVINLFANTATGGSRGSARIQIFSVKRKPTTWTFATAYSDTAPGAAGVLEPSGTPAATYKLFLMAALWEGADSTTATWANAGIEHFDGDVGAGNFGFHGYIGEDYRPVTASAVSISISAYTASDAGVSLGAYYS